MRIVCAGAVVLAIACNQPQATPSAATSASAHSPVASAAATPAPSAALPAPVRGLADPANDATLVTLARAALACKWDDKALRYDFKCDAYRAWETGGDAFKAPNASATLVSIFEDPDAKVRYLAVNHLTEDKKLHWSTDAALAKRVIAGVAAESVAFDGKNRLGRALAHIPYTTVAVWPDARAALEGTRWKDISAAAIHEILATNESNEDVWSWVASKAESPDVDVAEGAVRAFRELQKRKDDRCKLYAKWLGDARVAGVTVSEIAGRGCVADFDAALTVSEEWVKTAKLPATSGWSDAMLTIGAHEKATAAQKNRVLAVLAAAVGNVDLPGGLRAGALRSLNELDAPRGAALAKKLTHDKDPSVSEAAESVLAAPEHH